MPLIEKIIEATQSGALVQPFTADQMKEWMATASIVKDDGDEYAAASIEAILSNSDIANKPTTNRNRKVMRSKLNANSKKEYWF